MKLSGDDFRLVFWIALIPAYLSIVVLLLTVKELPFNLDNASGGTQFTGATSQPCRKHSGG